MIFSLSGRAPHLSRTGCRQLPVYLTEHCMIYMCLQKTFFILMYSAKRHKNESVADTKHTAVEVELLNDDFCLFT